MSGNINRPTLYAQLRLDQYIDGPRTFYLADPSNMYGYGKLGQITNYDTNIYNIIALQMFYTDKIALDQCDIYLQINNIFSSDYIVQVNIIGTSASCILENYSATQFRGYDYNFATTLEKLAPQYIVIEVIL